MTICSEIKIKLDVIIMTTPYVEADVSFCLDGENGDSYFVYNSASERVELWVKSVLSKEWGDVTIMVPYVDADDSFCLNGKDGDSYFVYNSTSERVELWINGVLSKEWGELEPGGNPFET